MEWVQLTGETDHTLFERCPKSWIEHEKHIHISQNIGHAWPQHYGTWDRKSLLFDNPSKETAWVRVEAAIVEWIKLCDSIQHTITVIICILFMKSSMQSYFKKNLKALCLFRFKCMCHPSTWWL